MTLTSAVLDDFRAFCRTFRIASLLDWQDEVFPIAVRRVNGRFVHPVCGISTPRGDGKTRGAATVGVWRLIAGPPPQDILGAALDLEGAKVMLEHARVIVRSDPDLSRAIHIGANALVVKATGSRWTITSREHTASRGRHPTVLLYDEVGWAHDTELFSSLLAGQASVADPLMLVVSTVGRRRSGPLWTIKTLAEGGDESVFWHHHSENRSPLVTPEFIARQRRVLMPAQFAREDQNQWIDTADSFTSVKDVDSAMARGWAEQREGRPGTAYAWFVDIGAVHDPTVIAIGHVDGVDAYVDRLITFQGSKEQPVRLASVERTIREEARRFPPIKIRIESLAGAVGGAVAAKRRVAGGVVHSDRQGARGRVAGAWRSGSRRGHWCCSRTRDSTRSC